MPSADSAVEAPPGPAPAAEYPSSAFVERLLELPVVTKTLNTVSNAYTTYARDSTSGIVKSAVSMADTTATTLVSVALPYLDAHKDTLAKVDSVACRGFDVVEERVERTAEYVANIQRRKDDVVNTVVNTYADPKGQLATVVSSVSDNVAAMKTTTTQKIQDSVASATNATLDLIEGTVDRLLPSTDEEQEVEESVDATATPSTKSHPVEAGAEVTKVIRRARKLVSKTQARALSRAMTQVTFAKARSQATVDTLREQATDLLAYAAMLDAEGESGSWSPMTSDSSDEAPPKPTPRVVRAAAKAVVAARNTFEATATNVAATVKTTKEVTTGAVSTARDVAAVATDKMRALLDLAIQHATDLRNSDNRTAFVASDFSAVACRAHTATARAVLAFEGAVQHAKDLRNADDRFAFVAADVSAMKALMRDMLWSSACESEDEVESPLQSTDEVANETPVAEEGSLETIVAAQQDPEPVPDSPKARVSWREVEPDSLPASPASNSMDTSFASMVGTPRSRMFEREV